MSAPATLRDGFSIAILLAMSACAPPRPTNVVEFELSAEQWSAYQDRIERDSRLDFPLSVRMGASEGRVQATAHLRGQTTFRCARRNYTLNLYGNRPRATFERAAADEFYLLSLCRDRGYVRQHTVFQLWRDLGLFPLEFRYVELRVNGRSQGLYLLVEKLDRVQLNAGRYDAVMRRRARDGKTRVDVKFSRAGAEEQAREYASFLDALPELSGERLLSHFRERLDVDQYMMWMASNTLLRNGDWIDELWLLDRHRGGRRTYSFYGWDPEDIFAPCHFGSTFAYRDPYGLAYCAESEWDHALLSDPLTYEAYVDILDELVERRLKNDVFVEALERSAEEALAIVARENVASAMVELFPDGPQSAREDLETVVDAVRSESKRLRRMFAANSARLAKRIRNYRQTLDIEQHSASGNSAH